MTDLEKEYRLAPLDVAEKKKPLKPKKKIDITLIPMNRVITRFTVKVMRFKNTCIESFLNCAKFVKFC